MKLSDFGTSTQITNKNPHLTQIAGIPQWMAPELIQGKLYEAAVDVWSFGVLMHELIERTPHFVHLG